MKNDPTRTDDQIRDEDLGDLTKEVSGLRTEFAEFRGRIETELGLFRGIAKGIAGKMFALIVAVFLGMAGVIGGAFLVGWQMSSVVSEVKQEGEKLGDLKTEVNDLKVEVKQHGGKLDDLKTEVNDLKAEVKQHGGKLDDLKADVKQLDGRMDSMAKQLETLIRRTDPKAGG